jgi:hypothetical protein
MNDKKANDGTAMNDVTTRSVSKNDGTQDELIKIDSFTTSPTN